MAIAVAIYLFIKYRGEPTLVPDSFWAQYGTYALLAAAVPALYYLRSYKRMVNTFHAAGTPSIDVQMHLLRRMSIGGALCELPMAVGVLQLLSGGDMRLFVGGALFAVALWISYRPTRR